MGHYGRRAVRSLKIRMQCADESISLRNISDEILVGIGRRGFDDCNRCIVGLPVAGGIPLHRGFDDKDSTTEENGSTVGPTEASVSSIPNAMKEKTSTAGSTETSILSLLHDASSSKTTADWIPDMVSRVGQWWYSCCYESMLPHKGSENGATAPGNVFEQSLWRNESLMDECAKRGTSMRLLIGYAKKPDPGIRRTRSL